MAVFLVEKVGLILVQELGLVLEVRLIADEEVLGSILNDVVVDLLESLHSSVHAFESLLQLSHAFPLQSLVFLTDLLELFFFLQGESLLLLLPQHLSGERGIELLSNDLLLLQTGVDLVQKSIPLELRELFFELNYLSL